MGKFFWYLVGFSVLLAGVLLGGRLGLFIDITSLTIVVGGITVFSVVHHRPGAIFGALIAAFDRRPVPQEAHHYQVLQNIRRMAMACGIIGGIIGLVIVLKYGNPGGVKQLGPGMAIAFLSMLYGLLISELLIGPLCSRIKARGSIQTDWNTQSDTRFYMHAIGIFAMLQIIFLMVFAFLWDSGWAAWD